MSTKMRDALIRYGITVALGAGLVWLILDLNGYAFLHTDAERFLLLCNAFTIPGTVMLMMGLLVLISGSGAYDGLGYVLHWLKMTLLPFDGDKQERFYDYVQRKHNRRKPNGGFLILTGMVFLAVAVVLMVLFYRVR